MHNRLEYLKFSLNALILNLLEILTKRVKHHASGLMGYNINIYKDEEKPKI